VLAGLKVNVLSAEPLTEYEEAPLAISVAVCPEQIVALVTNTVGVTLTLTVATIELETHVLSEPVNAKVAVFTGLNVNVLLATPFTENETAPSGFKVAVCHEKMVVFNTEIIGALFTLTLAIAILADAQLLLEPLTAYVVVLAGLNVKEVVAIPFTEYELAPDGVNVAIRFEHIVAFVIATVGKLFTHTCVVAEAGTEQIEPDTV
jgi:hypothetical protein